MPELKKRRNPCCPRRRGRVRTLHLLLHRPERQIRLPRRQRNHRLLPCWVSPRSCSSYGVVVVSRYFQNKKTSGLDWKGAVPALRLLLDALDVIATLLGGSAVALADTAAEGFLLSWRVCCGLWLPRRHVGGGYPAGRRFRTVAVVDFGFEGRSFLFDDAEAAFDGVIGGSWGIVSRRKKWVKVSRGGWRDTKGAKVVGTYRCHTWRRSCGSRAVDMMSVLFL